MRKRELSEQSPSETRALLLDLARAQASKRRPIDLLAQYESDKTVGPSAFDQRLMTRLDLLALDTAADYDAVLLSPVAPLGTNSVVAPTSQDRTLSTTRTTEVVSDPTNVLALVAAQRLRLAPKEPVRLTTVHQVLRMQGQAAGRGRSQHFRLFAMADAGRGMPDEGFEVAAVTRQLSNYDRLMNACQSELHVQFPHRRAIVRTDSKRDVLGKRVVESIARTLPHVSIETERLESAYYGGLRVGFGANDPSEEFCEIADLGLFDWVSQLTGNSKLRFVASALGIQLVPALFTTGSDHPDS
jgi:hypothetical protein